MGTHVTVRYHCKLEKGSLDLKSFLGTIEISLNTNEISTYKDTSLMARPYSAIKCLLPVLLNAPETIKLGRPKIQQTKMLVMCQR